MRGVRIRDVAKIQERNEYVKKIFAEDCKARAEHGFTDPPLSAPAMQKTFKKQYGVQMNSQRMYNLRKEVFKDFKLDSRGRPNRAAKATLLPPLKATWNGQQHPLQVANRDPSNDNVGGRASIIHLENAGQAAFLQTTIDKLKADGLMDNRVRIDTVQPNYVVFSNFTPIQ